MTDVEVQQVLRNLLARVHHNLSEVLGQRLVGIANIGHCRKRTKSIVSQISAFIGHPDPHGVLRSNLAESRSAYLGLSHPTCHPRRSLLLPWLSELLQRSHFVGTVVPRYTAVIGTAVAGRIVDSIRRRRRPGNGSPAPANDIIDVTDPA